MRRNLLHHIIEICLVVGIVLFVVLNSTLYFERLDLTSTKAYTISEVSQNLFREIDNSVSVTYYLSNTLRRRVPEVQEIEDLLREYAAYGRGALSVQVVDPLEEEIEETVQALGVVPQQFQVVEEGQQSFASVYTGIVIEYLDRYETLPVVLDPTTIEYQLTSTIREIVRDQPRSVGILVGQDGVTAGDLYGLTTDRLSRSFSVRPIDQGVSVPPDIDALFVLGHRDLDEYDLFFVDQFLMSGKSVFFGADGAFVTINPNLTAESASGSPLLAMLDHYGFQVQPSIVMDQSFKRIPITRRMGNATVQSYEPYPQWISIVAGNANPDHPVTARFSGLDLLWASPVATTRDEGAVTVLSTTADAWLMNQPYVVSPLTRQAFQRDAESTRSTYGLGVAYSGPLQSFFDEQSLPNDDTREPLPESVVAATSGARVFVLGDSEFASNYLQASDSGYNLTFIENVTEWMVNDEDLLSIRTRTQRPMGLDRIQDPNQRERVANAARAINVFIVPLALAFFGIGRLLRRRRRSSARGNA